MSGGLGKPVEKQSRQQNAREGKGKLNLGEGFEQPEAIVQEVDDSIIKLQKKLYETIDYPDYSKHRRNAAKLTQEWPPKIHELRECFPISQLEIYPEDGSKMNDRRSQASSRARLTIPLSVHWASVNKNLITTRFRAAY